MGGCETVGAAWHDGGSPIARGSSANRAAPQNKIWSIIRKAREEAGVPCDVESGQRLHDALFGSDLSTSPKNALQPPLSGAAGFCRRQIEAPCSIS